MEETYLIGSYSKNGIYKLKFEKGTFQKIDEYNQFENCSWLCKNQNLIYSIIEYTDNTSFPNGGIISITQDLKTNFSSQIKGNGPCHIIVDNLRKLLYLSNYGDGSLEVFNLESNKTIYYKKFASNSHIHCIAISNNILFVTDLGTDLLYCFEIIYNEKNFDLKEICNYKFPQNSSPRHIALSNNNIYVITEKSLELYKFSLNYKKELKLQNHVYILDKNAKKQENYTGSAIKISKNQKFIYAAIRGNNSISVFDTKTLNLVQNISCYGLIPRDIGLIEDYLFSLNQNSNNISIFKINKKTGELLYEKSYSIPSPACILKL